MAMTVNGMKSAILSELQSQFGDAEDDDKREKLAQVLSKAIVEYIQQNAQIPPGIAVQVAVPAGAGSTTAAGSIT